MKKATIIPTTIIAIVRYIIALAMIKLIKTFPILRQTPFGSFCFWFADKTRMFCSSGRKILGMKCHWGNVSHRISWNLCPQYGFDLFQNYPAAKYPHYKRTKNESIVTAFLKGFKK